MLPFAPCCLRGFLFHSPQCSPHQQRRSGLYGPIPLHGVSPGPRQPPHVRRIADSPHDRPHGRPLPGGGPPQPVRGRMGRRRPGLRGPFCRQGRQARRLEPGLGGRLRPRPALPVEARIQAQAAEADAATGEPLELDAHGDAGLGRHKRRKKNRRPGHRISCRRRRSSTKRPNIAKGCSETPWKRLPARQCASSAVLREPAPALGTREGL